MNNVTAHMVVKNEDQWVWFAIQSILPYVDKILITDTGSSDKTLECIRSIKSNKIILNVVPCQSPKEVTAVRQSQIQATTTDWLWIVDGDEIYSNECAAEVVKNICSNKFSVGVIRRFDLLGDIYHRQKESIGEYSMFGQKGHLLVRLINQKLLPGLLVKGDYPLEGYRWRDGSIENLDPTKVFITQSYLYHTMYLKRSSNGSILPTMINRSKYKIEKGIRVTASYPQVFDLPRPAFIPNPKFKRGLLYELGAQIITPLKELKRSLK